MASRTLNRRKLRDDVQASEAIAQTAEAAGEVAAVKPAKAKKATVAKVRKPRAKKLPPRMCARWGIFDGGMKQVAVFNYNERGLADEKLADLLVKKKGGFYIQIVKEAMAEPVIINPTAAE